MLNSNANTTTAPKRVPVCQFGPTCRNGKSCKFFHPWEIHCRDKDACKNANCHYKHPNRQPVVASRNPKEIECRFKSACNKADCPYKHSKVNAPGVPRAPVDPELAALQAQLAQLKVEEQKLRLANEISRQQAKLAKLTTPHIITDAVVLSE